MRSVTDRFSGIAASMWQVTIRFVRSGGMELTSRLVASKIGA
jgi:hypothetical protein